MQLFLFCGGMVFADGSSALGAGGKQYQGVQRVWLSPLLPSNRRNGQGCQRRTQSVHLAARRLGWVCDLWGERHKEYLKEHKQFIYTTMLIEGTLNRYLADINQQAEEMFQRLIQEMAGKQSVTETLKADRIDEQHSSLCKRDCQ